MRKHLLFVVAIGFMIGLIMILFYKGPQPSEQKEPVVLSTPPLEEAQPSKKISGEQRMGDKILADYGSPESDGKKDIGLFHHYLSSIFMLIKSRDSRQYAINEDLADFLRGKNDYKTPCVSSDSHIFNDEGMIIDRWGTPIHIHTISHDRFEIRSAGEDKKLFSEDDHFWPPPQPKPPNLSVDE